MSHIYKSCLIYMSHVSYIWVIFPTFESCLIHMSHVSHIQVKSHMYESCLLYMRHIPYIWVMSTAHAVSCGSWQVMSHMYKSRLICMSHVSYISFISLTCESCLLRMQCHAVRDKSCLIYTSHVSHIWAMSHTFGWHFLHMSHVYYTCSVMRFVTSIRRNISKTSRVSQKMSFVSYVSVMSPIYAVSCGSWLESDANIWTMSHVSHKWVMFHVYDSCLLYMQYHVVRG